MQEVVVSIYFVTGCRNRICVKGQRFLPFAKITGKNIGKIISRIKVVNPVKKIYDLAKQ